MNPEEAIKNLTFEHKYPGNLPSLDLIKAQELGIEALRRELLFRERVPKKEWLLLPGETK